MKSNGQILTSNNLICICYMFCIVAQVAICVLTPFVPESALFIPSYTIHIGVLGSGILWILENAMNGKLSMKCAGMIAFMVTCAISLLISEGVNYSLIIRILCLWETLFAMHIAYKVASSNNIIWLVKLSAWATTLGFYVQYTANLETNYKILFLGLNKNYSGAMLVITAAICMALSMHGSVRSRLLCVVTLVVNSYLISNSRCRTAILILLIILVAVFFARNLFVRRWFKHVVLVAPIILVILLLVIPSLNEIEMFGGSGSLTSNREDIYSDYLIAFSDWAIFGNIGRFKLENAHNGAIALLASLGIVGYCIWYANNLAFFESIRPRNRKLSMQSVAYIGLLCCMLIACTEALVYILGQQLAVMLSLLVYIVRYDWVHRSKSYT